MGIPDPAARFDPGGHGLTEVFRQAALARTRMIERVDGPLNGRCRSLDPGREFGNSLFLERNTLLARINSLFRCVGNFAASH